MTDAILRIASLALNPFAILQLVLVVFAAALGIRATLTLAFNHPNGVDANIPLLAAERCLAGGQFCLPSAFDGTAGRGLPFLHPPYLLRSKRRCRLCRMGIVMAVAAVVWTVVAAPGVRRRRPTQQGKNLRVRTDVALGKRRPDEDRPDERPGIPLPGRSRAVRGASSRRSPEHPAAPELAETYRSGHAGPGATLHRPWKPQKHLVPSPCESRAFSDAHRALHPDGRPRSRTGLTLSEIFVANARARIRWHVVGKVVGRWAFALWILFPSAQLARYYSGRVDQLWSDAHIYFRATETWVAGGNPWTATWEGIPFAAPPPALLLNVPLIPFGEGPAVVFWVVASFVAIVILLRRLNLAWWWIAFYPVFEGLLGATPDIVLTLLVYAGSGAIAAIAKPYSIPVLLSERRWHALGIAAVAVVLTLPVLPWAQFIESRALIQGAFDEWARPTSAWGNPLAMVGVSIALVLLGWKRGMALLTPGLLAQQPHYGVFSLKTISASAILMIALTRPNPYSAATGVMLFAVWERRDLLSSLGRRATPRIQTALRCARSPRYVFRRERGDAAEPD